MNLITFRTFEYAVEAHGLKSLLETNGLACYIFNENTTTLGLNKGNFGLDIKLKINSYDLKSAEAIVAGTSFDARKGESKGVMRCVNCSSENVLSGIHYFSGLKRIIFFLSIFVFSILPHSFKDFYRCKNCGHKFRM
jgi:DNA-directed RNA polymerase subunit RPC12/RpoP